MTNIRKEKLKKNLFFALKVLIPSSIIIYLFYSQKLTSLISIVQGIAFISALCGLSFFISFFKNESPKDLRSQTAKIIFLVIAIVYFFINPCFQNLIGFKDMRISGNGTYNQYVLVESKSNKAYTLTAEIILETYKGEDGSEKVYSTQKIYFNENQYLYFPDAIEFDYIGDENYSYDQNGNRWDVTLTSEPSPKKYFNEKLDISAYKYLSWIVVSLLSSVHCFLKFNADKPNYYQVGDL